MLIASVDRISTYRAAVWLAWLVWLVWLDHNEVRIFRAMADVWAMNR